MAYDTIASPTTYESAVVNDYAGSPASLTLTLALESFEAPEIDVLGIEEVSKASSTGTARHAVLRTGKALQQKLSFTIICGKLNETSGQEALFRGLAKNDLSGTSYSGWTVTSQLTGGNAAQIKIVRTLPQANGAAALYTYPIVVETLTPAAVGKARALKIDCLVVGDITQS